ncbi:hypothetical protein B7H23_07500 [Notoacmeibacter marinus]|uniref:HTH araC/xylS-type domain-containing protein n=1 Tax=Notoacmeibacter marinus TaxID=1876515 RepID=A0A231V3G3_9HYPH|nr:AraC family transcriptional regulator [Notoacmeibacter marinus]OXT02718.1 hypothetical protein B7H23_07500 [Notoacmeibacter marinus]
MRFSLIARLRASTNRFQVVTNRFQDYRTPSSFGPAMIALPIPLIVSLIALYLLLREASGGAKPSFYWALLASCALQGLLISLVHHYEVAGLQRFLPITASAIPPIAWIAFQTSLFRPLHLRQYGLHSLVPAFAAFCGAYAPAVLDPIISCIFLIYGAAILTVLMGRAGDLPLARLASGRVPVRVWQALALALVASAISDILIAVAMANGRDGLRDLIVSWFSSLSLLAIAVLSLTGHEMAVDEVDLVGDPRVPEKNESEAEGKALMARLDRILDEDQLYLDADLTLTRLARRLGVPLKQLSAAINRQSGDNVSRYVNAYRIRHACALLAQGRSVTETIFDSGFNTKSNFNREFRRITGMAPSAWQDQRKEETAIA